MVGYGADGGRGICFCVLGELRPPGETRVGGWLSLIYVSKIMYPEYCGFDQGAGCQSLR